MSKIKRKLTTVAVILFCIVAFYMHLVYKTKFYTGEMHYNLLAYYKNYITTKHVIFFIVFLIPILVISYIVNKIIQKKF